jgi:hypothetical protein
VAEAVTDRSRTLRWLQQASLLVFVVSTAVYNTWIPAADNDLWGHVHFGRVILESGRLPAVNEFSYTAPQYPWINHEVLAECALALAFDRFGSAGLLGLKVAVGLATLALLAAVVTRRTTSFAAVALSLILSGALISPGFLARPQIFTFLAVAALWERIDRYERTCSWRTLALLPVLFAIWTNVHGGVLAGLGIFLLFASMRLLSSSSGSERRGLAILCAVSLLALFVNPYGYRLVSFLIHDVTRERAISEWQPIPAYAFSTFLFAATIAAVIAGLIAGHRAKLWEIAVVSAAAAMALRHQRHLPLFAIVAAPLLAQTVEALGERLRGIFRLPQLSPAALAMLAVGVCTIALFELVRVRDLYRGLGLQIFVSPQLFPIDAVRFLKRNRVAGNLALPFDWGEYAIWHLHGDCRVSVDGRYTTAYPDDVLEMSARFQSGAPGWDQILRDANIALLDRRQRIVERMFNLPGWQYVYSDPISLIFVRSDLAAGRSFIREVRTDTANAFFFP